MSVVLAKVKVDTRRTSLIHERTLNNGSLKISTFADRSEIEQIRKGGKISQSFIGSFAISLSKRGAKSITPTFHKQFKMTEFRFF